MSFKLFINNNTPPLKVGISKLRLHCFPLRSFELSRFIGGFLF